MAQSRGIQNTGRPTQSALLSTTEVDPILWTGVQGCDNVDASA